MLKDDLLEAAEITETEGFGELTARLRAAAEALREQETAMSDAYSHHNADQRIAELESKLAAAEADAGLKQECLEWLAEDCETETEYDGQMLLFCSVCSALLEDGSEHEADCHT